MFNRYVMTGYPQSEIIIQFTLAALSSHGRLDDLDTIWDETILPLIVTALQSIGFVINNSELAITHEMLSLHLLLWGDGKPFNPESVVKTLKEHGVSDGLSISQISRYGEIRQIYPYKNSQESNVAI